jgi:hypothetical protein
MAKSKETIDNMRERVIDYYYNNDVFDDPYAYELEEEDLKDGKKVEKAIIKYHKLDDDSNVEERFEVLGLGEDDYAKGGGVKEIDYADVYPILKDKIDNVIDDIPYENADGGKGEEVEHQSRSGFLNSQNLILLLST